MEVKFRSLSSNDDETTFMSLSLLFRDMYTVMEEMGSNFCLESTGNDLWINSIKPSLGKVHIIYSAFYHEQMVGFAAGNIKMTPTFLGSGKTGHISYIYVRPEYRRAKVGYQLVQKLISHLTQMKVKQIDLEVLEQNNEALAFWRNTGFEVNTLRMVKKIQ